MKTILRTTNFTPHPLLEALIQHRLAALARQYHIAEAAVDVYRDPEASPAYRARLWLAVPGPDLRREQVDHSPLRACTRAFEEAERHLRMRRNGQRQRRGERGQRTASERVCSSVRRR